MKQLVSVKGPSLIEKTYLMTDLQVKIYGDHILRTVCTVVDDNITNRQQAVDLANYLAIMKTAVGLAAPQVGLNARMFCMLNNDGELMTIINPQIDIGRGNLHFTEGCLSIPNVFAKTEIRSKYLTATYYDQNFNRKTKTFVNTEAIIFQHEYDHLNGILFVDHLTAIGREQIADTLATLEKHPVRTYHPIFVEDTDTEIKSKLTIYR